MMSHTPRPSSITHLTPPSLPCWLTRCSGRIFQEQLQRAGLDRQLADLVELVRRRLGWFAAAGSLLCCLSEWIARRLFDCRTWWGWSAGAVYPLQIAAAFLVGLQAGLGCHSPAGVLPAAFNPCPTRHSSTPPTPPAGPSPMTWRPSSAAPTLSGEAPQLDWAAAAHGCMFQPRVQSVVGPATDSGQGQHAGRMCLAPKSYQPPHTCAHPSHLRPPPSQVERQPGRPGALEL